MKSKLTDFNLFYTLCFPVVQFATLCHYRRIVIKGKDNIPDDEKYILAPCHQNALMDPLVVLYMENKPVVFLARADIFKKPLARFLLTWLRISPVYRIRDGRDQLSNNEAIFNTARHVVEEGMPLCLMAEGTHNDKHQLLPLVKGMFRIAGATQMELGDSPLYIVPVGLDYDDYERPYSSVMVNVGKPIDVRNFMDDFESKEPVALNRMRDALTTALKAQIHHVDSVEHYNDEYAYCHAKTQEVLRQSKKRNTAWNRFQARQQVSRQVASMSEPEREACYLEGARFAEECSRKGVPLWYASKCSSTSRMSWAIRTMLMLIVLLLAVVLCWEMLPLWLLSNPIVYLPTHLIAKAKVKDPQFRSSINYAIRLGLTLVYSIVLFVVFCISRGFFWALGIILLGMFSAWLTPKVFVLLRDAWYGLKLTSKSK